MTENTPWEIEPHGDDWFNVTDKFGTSVAEAIPTASAAHMIAAAPAMLALLKLALGDTEYVLSKGFWDEVRAVVAKAEGSRRAALDELTAESERLGLYDKPEPTKKS